MTESAYDAVLDDWTLALVGQYTILIGTVVEDSSDRFRPNTVIHTSVLATPAREVRTGAVVETVNTQYLLLQEQRSPSPRAVEVITMLGGRVVEPATIH